MKIKPVFLLLFLVLGSIFLFVKIVYAGVVINEICPSGCASSIEKQWFEVYNNGTSTIDITGWQFYVQGESNHGLNLTALTDNFLLLPGEYAVVVNDAESFLNLYNNYFGKIYDSAWSHSLKGDKYQIGLKYGKGEGDWVEPLFSYPLSTGYSLEKVIPEISASNYSNWQENIASSTPGEINYWATQLLAEASSTPESTSTLPEATSTPSLGKIVINEFLPAPESGSEWLELYNPNDFRIDLNSWQLFDGVSSIYNLTSTIGAKQFLVINLSSSKLNNSGDLLVLKNGEGEIVDQVCYGVWEDFCSGENVKTPKKGNSLSRSADSLDTDNDQADFQETIELTPGAMNIIEAPAAITLGGGFYAGYTPYYKIAFGEVQINEIYPNPLGADEAEEFIELKNYTNKVLDLGGLYFKDESGAKYVVPGGIISENGLKIFKRGTTHLSLNNSGSETVYLYSPENLILDKINYTGSAVEGQSFAKDSEANWRWTKIITPEAENAISEEEEEKVEETALAFTSTTIFVSSTFIELPAVKEKTTKGVETKIGSGVNKKIIYYRPVNLTEVGNLEVGDTIKVQGVVSVLPGVFSNQYFYLANGDSGLQIYMYSKDFPELQVGDLLEARGELSYPYSMWRLKIKNKSDLKIIKHNQAISPVSVGLADLEENYLGAFLFVSGEITELKSGYLYLDDGTDEIKVVFKKGANLERSGLFVGSQAMVKGILSNGKSGFELLPRTSADIQVAVSSTAVVADSNGQLKNYLEVTAGGFFSILLGFVAKARARFVWDGGVRAVRLAVSLFKRGPKV